jgi:microcystin-dependent protein
MPRASDGNYSLPIGSIVNTGDVVLPSQHNPPLQDIAQALSNSLSRDGSGGMRAPLDMGANRIRNGAAGTLDTDFVVMSQIAGFAAAIAAAAAGQAPIGVVVDYAGSVAPTNYALCYGQELSRTDYAALFAVIGVQYGAGNGSTTFNLPDTRGRVVAGKDNMGGSSASRLTSISNALGSFGGEESHTLSVNEMPTHNHDMLGFSGAQNNAGGQPGSSDVGTANTNFTQTAGGNAAHNNVQPTLVLNKIIKVKAS